MIAQRTVNSLDSTPLLAVPMFIFAACIFNTAGITQQLFDWIRMLVGRIRGGLGYVTILTHLVFSGISGAALADIGALGSIQIRMMRQQGYKDEFSAGICMAASTLGPIFPPSIPLVIYATTVEISAVRLMLAGIIPALVIAAVLMAQVAWIARRDGLPVDTVEVTRASFLRQTLVAAAGDPRAGDPDRRHDGGLPRLDRGRRHHGRLRDPDRRCSSTASSPGRASSSRRARRCWPAPASC